MKKLLQAVMAVVLGFFTGYMATWLTTWMLGFEFVSLNTVALFASIASAGFILLILATVCWIGYDARVLYKLDFNAFLNGRLKDIMYFNGDVWNGNAQVLCWIVAVSVVFVLAKSSVKQQQESDMKAVVMD